MRRISALWLATALGLGASACKQQAETVEPEDDTWVPDESLEPSAAAVAPGADMTPAQKQERAKALYIEANGKAESGDWAAAVELYEQAYQLVPGKHGFALKVGVAAEQAGDCSKAISYYEHFLQYAEADKYQDDIASTQASLAALEAEGCE